MMRKVDQSPTLIRLLNRTSSVFARKRGLPTVIGILLIVVSMVLALVNLTAPSVGLAALQTIALHVGLLASLLGLLLAQPLGN